MRRCLRLLSGNPTRNSFGSTLPDVISNDGWEGAWKQSVTPWETGKASLVLQSLLESRILPPPQSLCSVLVPGVGSGHDAIAFARAGYTTVGLDLSPTAVGISKALGQKAQDTRALMETGKLSFEQGDLFTYTNPKHRDFTLIWDYTLLSALPPPLWADWAAAMKRLLQKDSVGQLLVQLFPVGDFSGGPPFAINPQKVKELLEASDFELQSLSPVNSDLSLKPRAGREWLGRWTLSRSRFPSIQLGQREKHAAPSSSPPSSS